MPLSVKGIYGRPDAHFFRVVDAQGETMWSEGCSCSPDSELVPDFEDSKLIVELANEAWKARPEPEIEEKR